MREPGGEIGNWLIESEVFLCESEGEVFDVRHCNNSHYSLPSILRTSPYSRTVFSTAASIRFFRSAVTFLPRIPATVLSVITYVRPIFVAGICPFLTRL